jgi:hypothetical protein
MRYWNVHVHDEIVSGKILCADSSFLHIELKGDLHPPVVKMFNWETIHAMVAAPEEESEEISV